MRDLVNFEFLKAERIFSNRTTLRRAIKCYGFPPPYRLGGRRIAWEKTEVDAWIASRRGQALEAGAAQ